MTEHKLKSAEAMLRSTPASIYLGVVAPTGIRRESFQAGLELALKPFGYPVEVIRLSELLRDFDGVIIDDSSEDKRLRTSMNAGSDLRTRLGPDVLARAAMVELQARRSASDDAPKVYVFWSLKHPQEVATLRLVYGASFHLVGLFASESERLDELLNRPGLNNLDAREHINRDKEESGVSSGQRSRDTFHRSDVFLEWGTEPDKAALDRFLHVLFGRPDITPTADEHLMFLAYASSLRSGELSRQVGAALVSDRGDLLALGANDVPRRGGGLYWPTGDDDRDAKRGEDANVMARKNLLSTVAESLAKELGAPDVGRLEELLAASKLRDITEYGRAVHAEMEALLACARSGRSTINSTLYVTTYPCHNCARHIIAAGVARVVFVEPYPKSRALELHENDVAEVSPGEGDEKGRVRFEPYLGIGPRRFFDYFSMNLSSGYELERKDGEGKLKTWMPGSVAPRTQTPSLGIDQMEKILSADLVDFQSGAS